MKIFSADINTFLLQLSLKCSYQTQKYVMEAGHFTV